MPPLTAGRQRQYAGPEPRIHYITYRGSDGMDTQQARLGLEINKFAWLENLQPTGKNDLIAVPGPASPPLTTLAGGAAPQKQFYANYNNTDYVISFMPNGSAIQTNLANGASVTFAPAATFTNPDCTQFSSDRILMADPTAGYTTWDGTVFVQSGGVSPNIVVTNGGTGYTSPPSVTISGGSGSGATATATTANNIVVSVQLTAAGTGYKAGDTLTVAFGGPGTGAAATAIIWPILTFPGMTTLAVFQGRVWIGAKRTLFWTGTKGFDDANAANASGSTILSDADLPHTITALRSLNNFLYIFGDQSIKQIGTIAVSSGVTLFTVTTLSSDQGTTFPLSIAAYNRLVVFANFVGMFAIFGATVEKISDSMDGFFRGIDFSQPLVGLSTDINNIRTYLLLVKYNDPTFGARSLFIAFASRKYYVVSQGSAIKTAIDAPIAGVSTVYASSTGDITKLLADTTVRNFILVRTSLSDNNLPMQNKRGIRAGITQTAGSIDQVTIGFDSENMSNNATYDLAGVIIWVNGSGGVVQWQNGSFANVNFAASGFQYQYLEFAGSGIYLGITLAVTTVAFHLNNIVVEYEEGPNMRSKNHG